MAHSRQVSDEAMDISQETQFNLCYVEHRCILHEKAKLSYRCWGTTLAYPMAATHIHNTHTQHAHLVHLMLDHSNFLILLKGFSALRIKTG